MKKIINVLMISAVLLCATACSSGTDYEETETITSNVVATENPTQKPNNTYQNKSVQKQEDDKYSVPEQYSVTVAISNAVIIDDGSRDGNVTYKQKCDTCGWTEPGTHGTTSGSMKSGFYCNTCKEQKVIELKTEYYTK